MENEKLDSWLKYDRVCSESQITVLPVDSTAVPEVARLSNTLLERPCLPTTQPTTTSRLSGTV